MSLRDSTGISAKASTTGTGTPLNADILLKGHTTCMRPNQFIIRDLYRKLLEDGQSVVSIDAIVDKICPGRNSDEKRRIKRLISIATDK